MPPSRGDAAGRTVAACAAIAWMLRFLTSHSTIVFVVAGSLVVFTLFRLELKQWRYTSSRDYLGIETRERAPVALALVEPQGLRINPGQLRGHRDAVHATRRSGQGIVRH